MTNRIPDFEAGQIFGTRTSSASAQLIFEGMGEFTIGQVATVGRAPDSDIHLDMKSVSRNHARIFYEGGHYWIKDLDSANGTKVNGRTTTLQMLSDADTISFGEVKAVFRTGVGFPGPAPIGRDPLEGSEASIQDGTPTGGLRGAFVSPQEESGRVQELEATVEKLREEAQAREVLLDELREKVHALESELAKLRSEAARSAGTPAVGSALNTTLGSENERLKRLVQQLERALADSNIRIRNLQETLDRFK